LAEQNHYGRALGENPGLVAPSGLYPNRARFEGFRKGSVKNRHNDPLSFWGLLASRSIAAPVIRKHSPLTHRTAPSVFVEPSRILPIEHGPFNRPAVRSHASFARYTSIEPAESFPRISGTNKKIIPGSKAGFPKKSRKL